MNFKNKKASESSNYTFETHEILLTVFTVFTIRDMKKILIFPFYSHNGKWEKKYILFVHRLGKELPSRAMYPQQIFPDSFFPPEAVFFI